MSDRPMSHIDTAWWRMDDPTNLMMITGVMVFASPIDLERLEATIEGRLLARQSYEPANDRRRRQVQLKLF